MADVSLRDSGIYAIRNSLSGKRYIGSAVDFRGRFKAHRSALRLGKHHSEKLQRAWEKYGEEAFDFILLEVVADKRQLIQREQVWIDAFNACETGYNVSPTAGSSLGRKATFETRKKMSEVRRNPSTETRAKMSAAHKGIKMPDHVREMLVSLSKGKVLSEETKKKISDARKLFVGWKHSEETKKKIGRSGVENSYAKLNDYIVRQMRDMCANGATQRSVARHFNVSAQTVCDVVRRKKWAHVE